MSKNSTAVSKLGVCFGLTLLAAGAQAHECRALGQASAWGTPDNPVADAYWLCVGFSKEDESMGLPGEGKPNNLDFFPFYVPGDNSDNFSSLDTSQGDKVDIEATLKYLNDTYFPVPHDEDFHVTEPWFFFTQNGVGYESPIVKGNPKFKKKIEENDLVKIDSEGSWAYRNKEDFILPFAGTYQWIVKGTVQKKGKPAVKFETKWTCNQPRIPYGPSDLGNFDGSVVQAPEGWFDCARPASEALTAATASRATTAANTPSSPPAPLLIQRLARYSNSH